MREEPRRPTRGLGTRLVPAGSVNRVLMVGGKNLTTFQSLGLTLIGLCVAGGIGAPILVSEHLFGKEGDHSEVFLLLLGAALIVLWGIAMVVNGLRGVVRNIGRRRTTT